jgi:metal-dependent amidase/aminoacylase/carboxypeptidase family protein
MGVAQTLTAMHEDFAFFAEKVPSMYFRVGVTPPDREADRDRVTCDDPGRGRFSRRLSVTEAIERRLAARAARWPG